MRRLFKPPGRVENPPHMRSKRLGQLDAARGEHSHARKSLPGCIDSLVDECPWQNLSFGRTTAKGKTIYLQILQWPEGSLNIPAAGVKVNGVTLLAGHRPLDFSQDGSSLSIRLPPDAPDPDVSVLSIETR